MFGVLNRFISKLDGEPQEQPSGTKGAFGFQVLKNSDTELAVEPWFDFVVGISGRMLENPDPTLFGMEVRNSAGSTVSLGVWSAKGQRIREVYVPVPHDSAALGLSLQWMPLSCTEDVWHILEVAPNSPADVAGLLPYGDYVIGTSQGFIQGEAGLSELVEEHLEQAIRLYVYNHEYNITRPVDITPSRNWGGHGALGCTLGFGALHRIPPPLEEPPNAPGETMFETPLNEKSDLQSTSPAPGQYQPAGPFASAEPAEFLVPANMQFQSPGTPDGATSTPPLKREKKARAHHPAGPAVDIDEYFMEGEQKSREEDHAPPAKTGGLPPPPKASRPPKAAPAPEQDNDA